jgi:hypothetical protein
MRTGSALFRLAQARRLRVRYWDLAPGPSLVEELITERREGARREDMR